MKAKLTLPDGREFEVEMSEEQFKDVTKKRFFEPKEGDEYLTLYGEYERHTLQNVDKVNASTGLAFATIEDAEAHREYLCALTKIRKYCAENFGEFVPDWSDRNQSKHYPYYDYNNGSFYTRNWYREDHGAVIYLSSSDDCHKLVKEMEKELKVVFGIS